MSDPSPNAEAPIEATTDPVTWAAEKAVVVAVAPLLGAALDGPLAGFAFNSVKTALGLDCTATQNDVAILLNTISLRQLQALRQAERTFRSQIKALQISHRRLTGQPLDSADCPDTMRYSRSYFAEIFAVIICVLFFGLLSIFAWHPIPAGSNETVLNVMVGTVAGSFASVVGYFFGSTIGSHGKDLLLLNSTLNKPPPP